MLYPYLVQAPVLIKRARTPYYKSHITLLQKPKALAATLSPTPHKPKTRSNLRLCLSSQSMAKRQIRLLLSQDSVNVDSLYHD